MRIAQLFTKYSNFLRFHRTVYTSKWNWVVLQRHWSLLWPETDHQTQGSLITRMQSVNMLCCSSAGVHTLTRTCVLFSEVFQGCVGRCQFKTGCWIPAILTTLTIVMIKLIKSSQDLPEFNLWLSNSCTLCCVSTIETALEVYHSARE